MDVMPRASIVLILAVVAVAAGCAGPAGAHDPVIPSGAAVDGVDVGGLHLSEAADRLERELGPGLRSPVRLRIAGRRSTLTARHARVRFDALRSARRANIAARGAAGDPVDVKPWVRFDRKRVRAFVARAARRVERRARDARLAYTVTKLRIRRGRVGYDVDREALVDRIELALTTPSAPRELRAARRKVRPDVTKGDLRSRDRTVVTVHRRGFRLRVFKGMKRVAAYPVAVGAPGHATPRGRFTIANKAVDPAWSAPDRPWAGAYRNEVVAGGTAENPLKARWLGIVDGVGIHGTSQRWSLGSRASHGCIRMSVPAVKRVYRLVPVGAEVMIK